MTDSKTFRHNGPRLLLTNHTGMGSGSLSSFGDGGKRLRPAIPTSNSILLANAAAIPTSNSILLANAAGGSVDCKKTYQELLCECCWLPIDRRAHGACINKLQIKGTDDGSKEPVSTPPF